MVLFSVLVSIVHSVHKFVYVVSLPNVENDIGIRLDSKNVVKLPHIDGLV